MDGAPVKGESIPIRVFLAGYDLTPTMRDINKKFSVRYFLNLVLMDTEDRRYFKQQEITLWRKSEKGRKYMSNSGSGAAGGGGSSSNLTTAQQNAQMPTHLVQGTSAILTPMLESISSGQPANQISPGAVVADQSSHMGLFTEEDSPQHEATGSKVRSNPLAFESEDDKTPSKEEEPPVSSKEAPTAQKQSSGESSSLFEFTNDGPPAPPSSTAVTSSNNDDNTALSEAAATDDTTND